MLFYLLVPSLSTDTNYSIKYLDFTYIYIYTLEYVNICDTIKLPA